MTGVPVEGLAAGMPGMPVEGLVDWIEDLFAFCM